MFGYTEKEVISKNIKVLMGEPHKSQHDGYLNAYKRTGVGKIVGTQTMVEGRSKTGDVVPVILSLVQVFISFFCVFFFFFFALLYPQHQNPHTDIPKR